MIIIIYIEIYCSRNTHPILPNHYRMWQPRQNVKACRPNSCFTVIIVSVFSPWKSSINENDGLVHIVSNSVVNSSTVFYISFFFLK
jgi:hypothetical protein